ncbi:tRNA-dihydrouridine synthase B [Spiroplasma sabaudiense Ar-1343]|uniref:tRNA-dihydrouridine synthase n=1 Tax=Spiroplasma sabaudiense Ar-1343 TaxID=1276257 RepID=W6AI94_9MOLU|nr:tRNA dihydrouridine synthase DusB [Spiroplasma sabaudiense]AHI53429.1 tRNA-dihydrouridine synthase B [Spiroplasma sabaudiense Ar-1343]
MKIGDIEINGLAVLGPMAGTTNAAFRIICKENGANLVFAEMVSSEGLVHGNKKSFEMIKVEEIEHPITLQIFGFDLKSFVKAAQMVNKESNCDIIDINMGCPAPKVAVKSQAGANLLKYPEKIYEIVKEVVKVVNKPVTVKLRIGWDESCKNVVEIAKLCEAAGASALTIHGRTRAQFFTGKADWSYIKMVKDAVKIPIIGNGDVVDGPSALKMLKETNCDAVMVARAAQGNPWIFKQINHFLETREELGPPTFEEWKNVVIRHTKLLIEMKGEDLGVREMRKQILWYLAVLPKNDKIMEMKKICVKVETLNDILALINLYE